MTHPQVVVNPGIRFGRPSMHGISTEVIADLYWLCEDVEAEYGLTRHELLVVLWFEGLQGQPRFRKQWSVWAVEAQRVLWDADAVDPDAMELPPTRADGQP